MFGLEVRKYRSPNGNICLVVSKEENTRKRNASGKVVSNPVVLRSVAIVFGQQLVVLSSVGTTCGL